MATTTWAENRQHWQQQQLSQPSLPQLSEMEVNVINKMRREIMERVRQSKRSQLLAMRPMSVVLKRSPPASFHLWAFDFIPLRCDHSLKVHT